jgi:two-component system, NarL family, nitrate/nitrite response regulator NarL
MRSVFVIAGEFLGAQCLAAALASSLDVAVAGVATVVEPGRFAEQSGAEILIVLEFATLESVGLAARLAREVEGRRILGYGIPEDLVDAVDWAQIGVCSCLPSGAPFSDLARAVDAILGGRSKHSFAEAEASGADLTDRELEILSLLAQGCSNAEIAEALHLQRSTVKNHVHRILFKLEARGRTEAALWYRRQTFSEHWAEPA